MTYHVTSLNGHRAIMLDEGRFLLDTGSPSSFSQSGRITFGARPHDVGHSMMGMLDAESLSGYVGGHVDGVIGMDILSQDRLTLAHGELEVGESRLDDALFQNLETSDFMGIPIITLSVNGHGVRVFVDSGAKISYLNSRLLESVPVEEVLPDFYPGFGNFTVGVSSLSGTIGGWHIHARFGRLPPLLQMTLMMGGVEGILGSDLFEAYFVRIERGGKPVAINPHI